MPIAILKCLISTIIMCIISYVSIPLAFTIVPITMQLVVCLISGALSGAYIGALAMLLYVFLGAADLPVFSGMSAGIVHLFGPTGGFIFGFIPCAFTAGKLTRILYREHGETIVQFAGTFTALSISTTILYLFGATYFSISTGCDMIKALALSVLPFIWIDLAKILIVVPIVNQGLRFIEASNRIRL